MKLTRRTFVTASTASAAAAVVGCQRGRTRSIEGEIVGAGSARGHLLRRRENFPKPSDGGSVGVVIAGGGVAGLSAAWALDRAGFRDFRLFELEPSVGGNARSGANPATAYPWGAHYLPTPPPQARAARALLVEAGVLAASVDGAEPVYDELALCQAPQTRLFIHGRWQDGIFPRDAMAPADADELRRFRAHTDSLRARRDPAGRPAFALPMELSSAAPELRALDQQSMAAWLDQQGYRSARLRWWIDYCLRDDFGCTTATTSAWAAFHYFCARGEDAQVLTWPEGNGFLVKQLARRAAGRISTGSVVYRVEPRADGALVDVLDTATGRTQRLRAQHVIYALPRFTTPYVVEGAARLGSFTYAPWIVANVWVDRAPADAAWDNVVYGAESLGYIVATHQTLRVRPEASVLTWYKPLTDPDPQRARSAMQQRSWASLRDEVMADLSIGDPQLAAHVRRVDVMLWGHAMIRPTPGFVFGADRLASRAPLARVRFAHSDMSGLSLFEEAQYRGVAAAEDVLADAGQPFETLL